MPDYRIEPMPPQLSPALAEKLSRVETATVGHSQHWGFMDRGIQPLLRNKRIAGAAVTLAIPGQDSTLLHHTLGLLRPGDILVVDRLGDDKHACWGGGVTVAAKVPLHRHGASRGELCRDLGAHCSRAAGDCRNCTLEFHRAHLLLVIAPAVIGKYPQGSWPSSRASSRSAPICALRTSTG